MTIKSRKEYLQAIRVRYHHASKPEKTSILNEFCINCGYHRKYAIRLLKGKKRRKSLKQSLVPNRSTRTRTFWWS